MGGGHRDVEGIQPERLNAEGFSPSALSRGLSVSATPGAVSPLEKRLKDANVAAKEADFRVFQTHHGRCYDTEGFASLHPRLRATRSARAFDLSGRAAVKLVIVSLSKAVHPTDWGAWKSKKRDSTTVNTIAEPYFLSLVNFYRTAITKNPREMMVSLREYAFAECQCSDNRLSRSNVA